MRKTLSFLGAVIGLVCTMAVPVLAQFSGGISVTNPPYPAPDGLRKVTVDVSVFTLNLPALWTSADITVYRPWWFTPFQMPQMSGVKEVGQKLFYNGNKNPNLEPSTVKFSAQFDDTVYGPQKVYGPYSPIIRWHYELEFILRMGANKPMYYKRVTADEYISSDNVIK